MKHRWIYIFTLFLCALLALSYTEVRINKSHAGSKSSVTINSPSSNSQKQPEGNSPFIRFHHGIDESGVSIASPSELIILLKPVNNIPEKFAGITEYVSTLSDKLPVTRVFLYSTPLRSPPLFS